MTLAHVRALFSIEESRLQQMTLAHVRALFSIEESRLRQTADTEMYHVTKFSV